ncbi:MAG: immunoglobulin domain-containing protein [Verrucomicrobiota bacterium]
MKTEKNRRAARQTGRLYALATSLALTTGLHASPVALPSTWGEYDYKQYLYGGSGNLALSGQSATGFTALVAVNDVDALNNTTGVKTPDGSIDAAGRPAVYQEFTPLDLSRIGEKVSATFNLKFNNALVANDQAFRFGFGNPADNSAFYIKMDAGEGGGDILGFRSDSTTTGTDGLTLKSATFDPAGNLANAVNLNAPTVGANGGFVSGFYSHFCNSGGLNAPGSAYPLNIGGNYPNNVGLGMAATLDVVHTITLSMERVAGGLKIDASWGNSAGAEVRSSSYSTPYIDADLPAGHGSLAQIGHLGFCMSKDDLFGLGAAGGSYTVSNFSLDYTPVAVATTTYSTSGFTVNTSEDLALNVLPSASGPTYTTNLASLTDGLAPNAIPGYDGNNVLGNGAVLTYDLGATAAINGIQTYTAWPGDRYLQDYTVDFSQDGFNWTSGVIAVVNQGTGTLGGWNNVKVAVANSDNSPLAASARYVRFNFNNQQNGAVGYTEIVVNGVSFVSPEAPNFWESPQSQTVTSGDSVTFTAQATGYPVPVITWHFIDSSSVDHLLSTVGGTLTFTSNLGSAGQYYAVASNSQGTVNSTPAAVLTVNPGIVENGDFSENAASFTQGNSYFAAQSPGNPASATAWTGGSGINGMLGSAPDYFGPAYHSIPSYLFMQGTQTVTQTITTTAGKSYRLSFKAACRENNVCGLTVWADNTKSPGLTIAVGALSGVNFQTYSFVFTGSGTQTIQFVNSGTDDFTADLTDVSVTDLGWADPFAAWINGLDWSGFTSPDKSATGDPDGDGMTNQQEYAFGLDPRYGSSANPITVPLDPATGTFSYTRRATPATTGLAYTVLTSTDLVTWTPDAGTAESITTSGDVQTVTFTVSHPAANGKLFLRVAAQ